MAQPTADSATQVLLGAIRKQAERVSKQHPFMVSASAPDSLGSCLSGFLLCFHFSLLPKLLVTTAFATLAKTHT